MLAAGASSRYGDAPPKQVVLLPRVLDALARARTLDGVVVVAGAHELATDARVVHAEEWERGPGASLRAGLAALPEDAEAALVVLADGPELDPRAVDRVVEAWQGEDTLAASYAGVRLHPVLLARRAWDSVPDEGARSLPAREIPCDDLTPPGDVDVS
ncbi:MAG TPA: NTP transferase domain-containing protein [Gaiellaceae bacterium]|nr:NTP transferase domain-containing protein [Gaiellaceae bacterium]